MVSDMDFARSVHHRAYREVIERQYGPWDEANQDRYFDSAWSKETHEIILFDGVRCGYSCVENQNDAIYLRELVIDPDFQNRGIGTHILRNLIDRAIERDVPLRLRTQIVNRAANLYRRMGFRETDRTESHLSFEWNQAAA